MARLLAEDPELQRLAGEHGYRTNNPGDFHVIRDLLPEGGIAPPDLIDSVDPPDYDRLEQLIEGVSVAYDSPPSEGSHGQ